MRLKPDRITSRLTTIGSRTVAAPKVTDGFYHSKEWRQLLAEIIAERGRICEDSSCPRPHPRITRVFGDHTVELKDGGAPLDKRNVKLLCGAAHTRKTLAARAARRR